MFCFLTTSVQRSRRREKKQIVATDVKSLKTNLVVPRQTQNLKRMEHMLSVTAEQLRHTRYVHDQLKSQVMTQHGIYSV